jgi:GNAT superfamily N-acetyltransferase
MEAQLRPYRIGDAQKVTDLWNRCLPADTITRHIFEEKVLLDPNFDLAGCTAADRDGEAVGFAHALVRRTPLPWGFESLFEQDREVGWVFALFVDQAHRRQGIGSALLERALEFLRERGAKEAVLFDYAPNYLLSGVDTEAYPGSREFFECHGFEVQGESMGMGIDLSSFRVPPAAADIERGLAREGIVVECFTRDYLLPTLAFLRDSFPAWLSLFTDKLHRGDELDEIVIARREEEVVGYCQHHYGRHVERTGPFGVRADLRNRKIGTLMLYRLLERMSQKGFKFGWFAQTGERQLNYYQSIGYRVIRTQLRMTRHL